MPQDQLPQSLLCKQQAKPKLLQRAHQSSKHHSTPAITSSFMLYNQYNVTRGCSRVASACNAPANLSQVIMVQEVQRLPTDTLPQGRR
jgi:hypothetical protein